MPFYNSNMRKIKNQGKGEYEMKIEILGMGCANCNKLYQNALEAVKLSGKEVEVTKIEEFKRS